MKIKFKEDRPAEILEEIKENLGGRKLGKIVEFEMDGKNLKVTIKKMGKSYLEFTHAPDNGGLQWELTDEKIALSHKAFKGEVLEKITRVVNQIGGEVTA